MGRNGARHRVVSARLQDPGDTAYDRRWAGDLRSSIRYALLLLGLLLLLDLGSGSLTLWRGALWLAVATLLFLVLYPRRVCAGKGWLASRGLLREQRVRTDALVSVRYLDGVAQRLLLRDAFGGHVEVDLHVLVENPELWHRLDEDVRVSARRGSLRRGGPALRRMAQRIDRETALTVFRLSGLD